jgi:acyl dehydratase
MLNEVAGRLAEARNSLLGVSDPIVISPAEEDAFAALIGDWDPMHNDPDWRQTGSSGPIVLGVHTLARIEKLLRDCEPIRAAASELTVTTQGLDRVRFPAPFPVSAAARIEVSVTDVAERDDGVLLRTSHRCVVGGSDKPAMVASHVALLHTRSPQGTAAELPADGRPMIEHIPPGTAMAPAARYDDHFFAMVASRSGDWLKATPWTSVSDREAHVFALLTGGSSEDGGSRAHPFAGRPIPRLQLLALRAYFSPYVGLPVLTDESMMAYNYGVDSARWYGDVLPGARFRDHVQLTAVERRAPGDYLVTTHHALEVEGNPHAVLVADSKTFYRSTH